jgi:hypothetical protein
MISFTKIDGTTYKMTSDGGREFHLMLLPRTLITKHFGKVASDITAMSKVLGADFEQYIFDFLCEYHRYRRSDEEKFDFLRTHSDFIVGYANIFVDRNGVDYSTLVGASNTTQTNGLACQVKAIIKQSGARKIFSLLSNTRSGPSKGYRKKLLKLLLGATYGGASVSVWVMRLLIFLDGGYAGTAERTIRTDSALIYLILPAKSQAYEPSFDHLEALKTVISILPILEHNSNPIKFFLRIIRNLRKGTWPSDAQRVQIEHADDDVDDHDVEDSLKPEAGALPSIDYHLALATELKKLISKIKSHLFRAVKIPSKLKSMEEKEVAKYSVQERLKSIEYVSPFWGYVTVPLLHKVFKIPYKSEHDKLLNMHPEGAALLSVYIGRKLRSIFHGQYPYLFGFTSYFPITKAQESATYRLTNIGSFIDTTLKVKKEDLLRWGFASRISFVRYIERFVGTMRTAKLVNVVTDQGISVDDTRLEKEAIDYFFHFLFTDKLNAGIDQLRHHISVLIN